MYTKEPQHFIIFDLEWNMAGRNSRVPKEISDVMPYEIIEIGAVKLDRNGKQEGKFQAFIKPVVYQELNHYVARVTNRGRNSLKFGQDFPTAMREFQEFCGDDYCFCTWSDSDAKPLKENLAFHQMDDQLAVRVLDVQRAFTAVFEEGGPQRSIEYALDFLRIPKKDPFHQAVSDALYTGDVLREVLLSHEAERKGMELEAIETVSLDTSIDLMNRFSYNPDLRLSSQQQLPVLAEAEDIPLALSDSDYICPACERALSLADPAWTESGRHFETILACSEHGAITGKARQRRNKEGKYFVTVNLRLQHS